MIENIIVDNGNLRESDKTTLFGEEEVLVISADDIDIPRLMVRLGLVKSTTQARNTGRTGPIPPGYTEYKATKVHRLFFWNPTEP